MKWIIASDLHGNAGACTQLLRRFDEEGADKLILLGDLLYHGPRNPLPDGYAPADVATQLAPYSDRIFCVRGNCDSEVDQAVLSFPMLEGSGILYDRKRLFYLYHGHQNLEALPMPNVDVLVQGHTHVAVLDTHSRPVRLNPGSVGIPKDGTRGTYALLSEDTLSICDLVDGHVLFSKEI